MAETIMKASSSFNGEYSDDDIYEKIEAPKFVDFTRPDPPLLDQDRSWFCVRIARYTVSGSIFHWVKIVQATRLRLIAPGPPENRCDQQHEEIDPDALYKSFRLRVLAARSPNLRFQKALSKRAQSITVKCPLSAPAKPSKPRLPRLLISSISRSITNSKANAQNSLKLAATPKARAKASSVATKALTTPSHKRPIPKSDNPFRSVRNPKKSTTMSKTRVVAKALVFDSLSKTDKQKKKSSSECSSQTAEICIGMKKTSRINAYNAATASSASKSKVSAKKLRNGGEETLKELREHNSKSFKCLMKSKSLRKPQKVTVLEEVHNEYIDMDTDRKSLDDPIHVHCAPDRSTSHEENESTTEVETGNGSSQEKGFSSSETSSVRDKAEVILTYTSSNGYSSSLSDSDRGLGNEDPNESETLNGNRDANDKENDFEGKRIEANNEGMEYDDKENAAASDNNRNPDSSKEQVERKMDVDSQKATKAVNKTPNGSWASAFHGIKYKKPMPTNPKPFRLRTDERGTLREANLEKKNGTAPLKEITTVPDGKSETRHVKERSTTDCLKTPKPIMEPRSTSAKPESRKELKERDDTKTVEEKSLRSDESPSSQKLVRPLRTSGTRKGMKPAVSSNQSRLKVIKELKEASVSTAMDTTIPEKKCSTLRAANPAAPNASISKSSSQRRRPTTFPRDPSFQEIHITPKSCTKASNISRRNNS
ncbi:hypothetical protein Scep_002997 [Stephania cephalantha]|uniref:Uncharacterized protein n=1 Tax=Stephania cephalantha TaxID=152367 RepID=A0AAP0LB93_9MAGN